MEWTTLRDLVAVAETGSLSGAARVVGVSQPTLGRRIEQLEKQLNAQLFNRTTRGLSLTEIGERVLAYAQQMSEQALAIERIATGAKERLAGSVRITLTDMMGNHWLPQKLAEFYSRFPGLRLEIVVENRTLDLIRREADIAVRFARPQQLDLVTRRATLLRYGLYGSSEYLRRHGRPEQLRDLRKHFLVSYDESIFNDASLKKFERLFGDERVLHRSNSNEGILAAITAGVGLGLIAGYFADRHSGLERLMPAKVDYHREAWVVTHADLYQHARIRIVFNFLIEKLLEDAVLICGADD
jgi:DNA-binding transcriptional LysR family regulator